VFNYLSEFEAFEAGGSDISLAMAVAAGFDESAASSTAFNHTARDISSIPKVDFSRSRLGSPLLSSQRSDWTKKIVTNASSSSLALSGRGP
jgi:hypothetical protein